MKKNRCLWGAAIAVFSLLFLYTLRQELLILTVAIILLPVLSAGCNRAVSRHLEIELSGGESELQGRVDVKNSSFLGIPRIVFEIQIQNLLTMEINKKQFTYVVRRRERETGFFFISAERCGCMEISVKNVILWDMWGIFPTEIKIIETRRMNVWPDLFEQQIVVGKSDKEELDSFEYSMEKPGNDPGEMFDIRDYIPGDRMSSIHWKLSGKYDRLMIVRPGLPLENSILLLFETGYKDTDGEVSPSRIAAAANCFTSICRNLISEGRTHRIGWVDGFTDQFVLYEIASEEDFTGILPKFLSAGYVKQQENVWTRYFQLNGDGREAHIVCVAHELTGEEELLQFQGGRITILLSNASQAEKLGYNVQKLGFSEEGYCQDLYYLEI